MLMNMKELSQWLDKRMNTYSIERLTAQCLYTPIRYKEIYEKIGWINVWNDVGCIEYVFEMYRPIDGGTIVYNVE